jgi:hypothetical protein
MENPKSKHQSSTNKKATRRSTLKYTHLVHLKKVEDAIWISSEKLTRMGSRAMDKVTRTFSFQSLREKLKNKTVSIPVSTEPLGRAATVPAGMGEQLGGYATLPEYTVCRDERGFIYRSPAIASTGASTDFPTRTAHTFAATRRIQHQYGSPANNKESVSPSNPVRSPRRETPTAENLEEPQSRFSFSSNDEESIPPPIPPKSFLRGILASIGSDEDKNQKNSLKTSREVAYQPVATRSPEKQVSVVARTEEHQSRSSSANDTESLYLPARSGWKPILTGGTLKVGISSTNEKGSVRVAPKRLEERPYLRAAFFPPVEIPRKTPQLPASLEIHSKTSNKVLAPPQIPRPPQESVWSDDWCESDASSDSSQHPSTSTSQERALAHSSRFVIPALPLSLTALLPLLKKGYHPEILEMRIRQEIKRVGDKGSAEHKALQSMLIVIRWKRERALLDGVQMKTLKELGRKEWRDYDFDCRSRGDPDDLRWLPESAGMI